jgi:hypothetical protein
MTVFWFGEDSKFSLSLADAAAGIDNVPVFESKVRTYNRANVDVILIGSAMPALKNPLRRLGVEFGPFVIDNNRPKCGVPLIETTDYLFLCRLQAASADANRSKDK